MNKMNNINHENYRIILKDNSINIFLEDEMNDKDYMITFSNKKIIPLLLYSNHYIIMNKKIMYNLDKLTNFNELL